MLDRDAPNPSSRLERTRGCLRALAVLALSAMLGAGCIPDAQQRLPLVQRQAAKDFHCAASQVTVEHLGERFFGATGCGRHTRYQVNCHLGVSSCYLIERGEGTAVW